MAELVEVETLTETASRQPQPPHVRNAIAVVMTWFPRIDETYILREINELEQHGQPVVVVPIVRETPLVVHEEAKRWVPRALYTPFLSREILASNLRAFFATPLRYLKLLATLIAGTFWRPSTLVRTLSIVPKAVHLARTLTTMGIRHVHSHFATHASTLAFAISYMSDITFSFTVHGPDVFVHRLLLREKLRRAKFVRCVSVFNKAFLAGLYPHITEGKLEVVRTGVNPDIYDAESRRPHAPRLRPRILSVAALTPRTGFSFLIDACARLVRDGVDVECLIVGSGPLRPATEQWIGRNGLSDHVRILGNLPQHEVARLMGETDIFVLPSIIATDGQMDGIPVSLMEAMAAGKPVVASPVSGIPELVRHEISGLLVDGAYPDRIASAVKRLIENPALRERLGSAAKNVIRDRFDVRETSKSLVRLFDRAADVNEPEPDTVQRILNLNWRRMNATALGVRRVHENGASYLAEVTIHDGVTTRDVVVRRHCEFGGSDPRERARTEFEALTTLHQSLSESGTVYSVPRLLMFDEPNAAIVVERADGNSLAGLIAASSRRATRRAVPALRKAGNWLRTMQEQTSDGEDGRHILTAVVLLAIRDAGLVVAAERSLRRHHDAITERLQQLESEVAEKPLRVAGHHGTFRPSNVFVGPRSVEVVDFGSYREGLPLEDVAEMLLHLELRGRGERLEMMRHAFLEGYGVAEPDRVKLELFTLTRALQLLASGTTGNAERRKLRKIVLRSLS